MTHDECEILQDLKIIKMLLNDIYCKIQIDDFWAHAQIELLEKSVKDMNYIFSGGTEQ